MDNVIRKWEIRNIRRVPVGIRINHQAFDFAVGESRIINATADLVSSYFDLNEWNVKEIVEAPAIEAPAIVAPPAPVIAPEAKDIASEPKTTPKVKKEPKTAPKAEPKASSRAHVVPDSLIEIVNQNKDIIDNCRVLHPTRNISIFSDDFKALLQLIKDEYSVSMISKALGMDYKAISNQIAQLKKDL